MNTIVTLSAPLDCNHRSLVYYRKEHPCNCHNCTGHRRYYQWRTAMMSRKKIVVAVDGSEHSNKIIDKAIEYSNMVEARIILVYCHKKFSAHIGQLQADKEIPLIKKESQQLLDPYIERFKDKNIEVEQRIMEEPAGAVIADIATIEKCDLIIMGSRGLTNLASLIVGSVTNRVLQTAPCSVLVVK